MSTVTNESSEINKVKLLKTYKKYLGYIEQEQRKKYRDGIWTGDNYEPFYHYYLLPGIHINAVDDIEYMEVSINQSTLPSELKFGQNTLLNAIHSLKSISELSDNFAANKEKMAATLQSALKNYLFSRQNKFEPFAKRVYIHAFIFLVIGIALVPVSGPAIILCALMGIITGAIHHSFSWCRRMSETNKALVVAAKTIKQQITNLSDNPLNSSFSSLSCQKEAEQLLTRSPDYEVRSSDCHVVNVKNGENTESKSASLFFSSPKEREKQQSSVNVLKNFFG